MSEIAVMAHPAGKTLTVKEELQHILREAIKGKITDDAQPKFTTEEAKFTYRSYRFNYPADLLDRMTERWMQLLWPAISKSIDIEHEQAVDITNDYWLTKLRDVCIDVGVKHNYL